MAARSDETETTAATYDEIAGEYAARWGRGEALAATRARFAALLPPGAWVLDVGCGPGHDAVRLREHGLRVGGLDRSRSMVREARGRGLAVALGDMRRLPVQAGRLDGLWVSASLLHIPKREAPAVLVEFQRALRAGGILYLGVKAGAGEDWPEAAQYARGAGRRRFFAYYAAEELDDLLARAGFEQVAGWTNETHGQAWLGRLCRGR